MSSATEINEISKGPHALSAFIVQHLIAPVAGVRDRFPNGPEFVLAVLLHVLIVYLFFLHEHYALQPFHKEPPVITVELVPEPQIEKPVPEEAEKSKPLPYRNEESGGAFDLKSGRSEKVDKSVVPTEKEEAAKEPLPDKAKTTAVLPDWAKKMAGTYELPKPRKSSAKRDAGRADYNRMSDHTGEGGGEAFFNKAKEQFEKCRRDAGRLPALMEQQAGPMVITLTIDRRGALQTLDIGQSSGLRDYDLFMLDVARKCQPFPPLPDYIEQGQLLALKIGSDY